MLQGSGGVAVVNGQLVSQAPAISQYVTGYAPYSALGPAYPLSIPPTVGSGGVAGGTLSPSGPTNQTAVANAASNPLDPRVSPVVPALVGLALALFALHAIHFRESD